MVQAVPPQKRAWEAEPTAEQLFAALPLRECQKYDEFVRWIDVNLGIKLPCYEDESPSKRSKSPSHLATRRVHLLCFQERPRLIEVLDACYMLKAHEDSFTVLRLTKLLESAVEQWRVQRASRQRLSSERRRSNLSHFTSADSAAALSPMPVSPILSTKRPQAGKQGDQDDGTLYLPTDEHVETGDAFGRVVRSSSNLFGTAPDLTSTPRIERHLDGTRIIPTKKILPDMPPPHPRIPSAAFSTVTETSYKSARTSFDGVPPLLPGGNISANTSFSTDANTSFNTDAYTSFWSEPAQSTATSLQSSMCVDGAKELVATQSTTYGEFPSQATYPHLKVPEETLEHEPEPQSSNYEQGESLSQMEYTFLVPQMKTKERQGDDHNNPRSGSPRPHNGEAVHIPMAVPVDCRANTDEAEKSDKPLKTPNKPTGSDTPSKVNWRYQQIIDMGFQPVKSPAFHHALPFNLQWETARVLQNSKVTLTDLQNNWPQPRTMDTLYALKASLNCLRVAEFDDDSTDFSLSAKLVPNSHAKDGPPLKLQLLPPRRQQLNEFERSHGATRVITVQFSPESLGQLNVGQVKDAVGSMVGKDNMLFGRTWVEFYCPENKRKTKTIKAGTVDFHLFATNGPGLPTISIGKFVNDLLPFRENGHQLSGKLYARFEMKGSRTTSSATFRKDQIEDIDDILATDVDDNTSFSDPGLICDKSFDANDRAVMTDGCGTITPEAMRMIWNIAGKEKEAIPSAVQGRFAGCKGVWFVTEGEKLFPDSATSGLQKLISNAKSMMKIAQMSSKDTFMFVVVQFPKNPKPSVLYTGFLPILCDRSGADAMTRLCDFVKAQIRGLLTSFEDSIRDPNDFKRWLGVQNDISNTADRHLGIETMAGFPVAKVEKINQMLESGFQPTQCKYLAEEVKSLLNSMLSIKKKKFRIPLGRAIVTLGVPDWTGTLEPGQIYFAFSKDYRNPITGKSDRSWANTDCLVARNPARRASDIQKLRIVKCPPLSGVENVIVFSTKGRQSEASKLQGGDYDGDVFWLCVEQELVEHFKNAPAPRKLPKHEDLCISKDSTTFDQVVTIPRDPNVPFDETQVRDWLARNRRKKMEMNRLGQLTRLQERQAYHFGIDSNQANVMNDLCDYMIDAPKQCLTMSDDGFIKFLKRYKIDNSLSEPAHRKYTSTDDEEKIQSGEIKVSEPLESSIVDKVYFDILEPEIVTARALITARTTAVAKIADQHLTQYYNDALTEYVPNSAAYRELKALPTRLGVVTDAGKAIQSRFKKSTVDGLEYIQNCRTLYDNIKPDNILDPVVQEWTKSIGNDHMTKWALLKASALANRCCYTQDSMFKIPFQIAGDELCRLKVYAVESTRTVTMSAYLSMKPANMTAFASSREIADDDESENISDDSEDDKVKVEGGSAGIPKKNDGQNDSSESLVYSPQHGRLDEAPTSSALCGGHACHGCRSYQSHYQS